MLRNRARDMRFGAFQHLEKFGAPEGLSQKIESACFHCLNRIGDIAEARQEDDRVSGLHLGKSGLNLQAVHFR
jgi:hypothetical protein